VPYYIDNKGSSSVVVKSFGGVTTFATILRGHRFVVRPTSTVSENWSGVQIPFLFGGALNLGSNKVTNMTAGTAGTDGVNKTQLDAKLDSATLTTKGDILTRTASAITRLGVGSDGQVLTADSAQTAGIKWATPSGGGSLTSLNSDVSGLAVSSGIWSDLTSLSLTAGTWMISGLVQFATNLSGINDYVAITKYSGNDGTSVVYGQNAAYSVRNGGLNGNSIAIPSLLVVVPSTETWYLKATTDNGGTATGIGARLTAVKIA
jgi:hypothetical protein